MVAQLTFRPKFCVPIRNIRVELRTCGALVSCYTLCLLEGTYLQIVVDGIEQLPIYLVATKYKKSEREEL